jgi:hypothetical protein
MYDSVVSYREGSGLVHMRLRLSAVPPNSEVSRVLTAVLQSLVSRPVACFNVTFSSISLLGVPTDVVDTDVRIVGSSAVDARAITASVASLVNTQLVAALRQANALFVNTAVQQLTDIADTNSSLSFGRLMELYYQQYGSRWLTRATGSLHVTRGMFSATIIAQKCNQLDVQWPQASDFAGLAKLCLPSLFGITVCVDLGILGGLVYELFDLKATNVTIGSTTLNCSSTLQQLVILYLGTSTLFVDRGSPLDPQLNATLAPTVLSIKSSAVADGTSLGSPLKYNMTLPAPLQAAQTATCVYWNYTSADWRTDGCVVSGLFNNQSVAECSCTHLTNFGVLVTTQTVGLSKANRTALDILTYIGLVISMFSLAIVMVTYWRFPV